uniref:Uncharacterized protein n=1 Tax=Trichinella nativa TaxID=6335 RepID=A0A0V1KH59_9BILA
MNPVWAPAWVARLSTTGEGLTQTISEFPDFSKALPPLPKRYQEP